MTSAIAPPLALFYLNRSATTSHPPVYESILYDGLSPRPGLEEPMVAGKIWKAGDGYVVHTARRNGGARMHAGQMVGIDPIPMEIRPVDPLTPQQRSVGWKNSLRWSVT